MIRFRVAVLLASCLVLFGSPAFGQLSNVPSEEFFAADSVKIDLSGLQSDAEAARLYAEWGIVFPPGVWGSAKIKVQVFGAQFRYSLRNELDGASSAGLPLVVDFRYPVRRLGFRLSNGSGNTQVTLDAFDARGNQLGTLQKTGANGDFFGVYTSSEAGISKAVISYGNSANEEEIYDLIIEYVSRPTFVTYLAQLADGPLSPSSSFQTTIVVSNLTNSTAVGEISFFTSMGDPLSLPIGESNQSSYPFSLPAYSSKSYRTKGTSNPVSVGYAKVSANVPMEGTAIFGIYSPDGKAQTEAGVGSEKGSVLSVGAVQKTGTFDSGIAAVNVGARPSDARVLAYDEDGSLVAVNDLLLDLAAGNHVARFLSEIFPSLAQQDFKGSLVIVSDAPLAVVILRTSGGLVLSSLPVGSTQH